MTLRGRPPAGRGFPGRQRRLRQLRDELQDKHRFQSVSYYRKESFSRFADPQLIEQIRAENDIVVTAIGD